jgi:glycosyltransferase involved in cell wall biosynthesis
MPDNPPLVSVVIPAYGVTNYIAETLTSVLNQTFQDFEVVLVNDCCPDSARLDAAVAPYLSRIRYIRKEKNGGLAAARNTGIQEALGEWIAFLDGDDTWEPNYLAVQTAALRDDPDACVVYGNARIMGSVYDGQDSQRHSPSSGPVTINSILRGTVSIAVLNLSRKKEILDTGLFDESLRSCEDFDLWLRIVLGGGKIIYHSQVIAGYRRRDDSLSANPWGMLEARLIVLKKLCRDSRLKAEDRKLAEELALEWTAEAELEFSKREFAVGKREEALRYLASANTYYKRRKLTVAHLLMKHSPSLLRALMKIRRKTNGF